MLGNLSEVQAAVPAVIAVLSGLIGFFRIHGRAGRLRTQIKETLELSKLAEEAKATAAKTRSDDLASVLLDRLRIMDSKAAERQYDKQSLGVVIVLIIVGVPLGWVLWLPGWIVTTIFAWVVFGFLLIFVPVGIVMFFTGGNIGSKKTPPIEN